MGADCRRRTSADADKLSAMAAFTHVLEYDGGIFTREIGPSADINVFADTLRRFDGAAPWALSLWALPDGKGYDKMLEAGEETTAYLQAGGRHDAMTVQIRKPGGHQWGVESVRYIVGHPHDGNPPADVPIALPRSTEMVSRPEVFDATEAAELFFNYYATGDIGTQYSLRPVEGWTADGTNVDLR